MIIGFMGHKGSGKTTACNALKEVWGDTVTQINMKDALVAEIRQNMPKVLDELSFVYDMSIDELFEKKPPIMRALMQNYGTELRRREHEDYWVRKWQESYRSCRTEHVIVDDIRFRNEAACVTDYGGILILLERPDMRIDDAHVSERELKTIKPDFTIETEYGEQDVLTRSLYKIIS